MQMFFSLNNITVNNSFSCYEENACFHFRRDIAIVQIFYEENSFRSSVKDELIGFTEFLCNYPKFA